MSTIKTLGPVGFNPVGEYDNSKKYERLDVVLYQGASYVALKESIGQLPTNTEYWDCLGISGADISNYYTKNETDNLLDTKQSLIDNDHKLSSDLVDDTNHTHKFVSESEKTTWNNKSDFSGNYNDLTNKPDLNVYEEKSNKTTTLSSSSTNIQYPSAKCVYDSQQKQNTTIEELINNYNDLYNAYPKVSDTGEVLSLTPTKKGKMSLDLKGNTSQTGTPTPTSPIPVNVVSGNNEINVVGKNLLNYVDNLRDNYGGLTSVINENGSITTTGKPTNEYVSIINLDITNILENGATYTLSQTTLQANKLYLQINIIDLNGGATQYASLYNTTSVSFTADTTNKKYIMNLQTGTIANWGNDSLTITNTYQLEKSNTKTDFEPYQGASYQVNLGSLELCKIGSYQDYIYKDSDKWYLYKEIGKVVLDGSEDWFKHGSIASWFYYDGITDGYFSNARSDFALCNYFIQNSYSNVVSITNGQLVYGSPDDGTTKRLVIKNTDYTEIADFKTWLSTHNTTIYYVLETPTTTEITDSTLLSKLEALSGAKSYDEQTNISQNNNDLGFIISASALKDIS